ncbi:MAG TPA: F0F1 ATP synthase subunit delta, partial [Cyclobacteriaceae bacterium]|nr:F0F1 ATP synthase subunit delta [Cyclobacteriaceae bacterium]
SGMNQSKIAVRYAKAFFDIAQEKKVLDEVKADIEKVSAACSSQEIQMLLESPVVKTSQKKAPQTKRRYGT